MDLEGNLIRSSAVLLALAVVSGSAFVPPPARGAEPTGVAGARELAVQHGGEPNDFELV